MRYGEYADSLSRLHCRESLPPSALSSEHTVIASVTWPVFIRETRAIINNGPSARELMDT